MRKSSVWLQSGLCASERWGQSQVTVSVCLKGQNILFSSWKPSQFQHHISHRNQLRNTMRGAKEWARVHTEPLSVCNVPPHNVPSGILNEVHATNEVLWVL